MGFSDTAKRHALAASGNQCAHPACSEVIFDPDAATLIGQVAHIKGNRPGSARHDPTQTDDDRQSLTNAIVLCSNHHAVVDNPTNIAQYSAERLSRWKTEHEAKIAEQHTGSWLRPPNSITQTDAGSSITIHYWVDGEGRAHPYSDKQFAQSEAALQLSIRLSQFTTFLRMIDATTIPVSGASDGGQIAYIKKQATELASSPELLIGGLIELFKMMEDVTFGEFIAAIIQPRPELADYERRREDIAREAEAMQRKRATHPRIVDWRGNR